MRRIATALERSPSTISREIRRNRHPINGQYRPHAAEARAVSRRTAPSRRRSLRTRSCGSTSTSIWAGAGARSRSCGTCCRRTRELTGVRRHLRAVGNGGGP
ncbi:helix-turn-helix domain-containing protein [Streptomyces sp. NPDC058612]|uniref:helix-turn-helix domain-containing protein n=1 Tax=Streptomyces sp. NPDC058612 TaxID=3346555 RepID=UPI00364D494B